MTHLELNRGSDVLTAIPEAYGWLDSDKVGYCCDGENQPSQQVVQFLVIGKHPLEFVAAGEFMKISKLGDVNILLKKDAEKLKKMI